MRTNIYTLINILIILILYIEITIFVETIRCSYKYYKLIFKILAMYLR